MQSTKLSSIFDTASTSLGEFVQLNCPDSKVHGANMGLTWVLSAPDGPMLAPWTMLSRCFLFFILQCYRHRWWGGNLCQVHTPVNVKQHHMREGIWCNLHRASQCIEAATKWPAVCRLHFRFEIFFWVNISQDQQEKLTEPRPPPILRFKSVKECSHGHWLP